MLKDSPAFKKIIKDYLEVQKNFNDINDGCFVEKPHQEIIKNLQELREIILFTLPKGTHFIGRYMIARTNIDFKVYT